MTDRQGGIIEHGAAQPKSDDAAKPSAQRGAIFMEYGLLISLIAAVAAAGVTVFGQEVRVLFDRVVAAFP